MSLIKRVENLQQYLNIIDEYEKVLIDFSATWCRPCNIIHPLVEELASKNTEIVFLEVDVDDCPDIASKEDITAMPTFIYYFDGQKQAKIKGASPENLKKIVSELNIK